MRCSNCQCDNPEGARFCGECGIRLGFKCQICGKENPPTNRFCLECGHRLGEGVKPAKTVNQEEPISYIPPRI